jgi:hypothetical protein
MGRSLPPGSTVAFLDGAISAARQHRRLPGWVTSPPGSIVAFLDGAVNVGGYSFITFSLRQAISRSCTAFAIM